MKVTVGRYNVKNLFMQEDITAGSRTKWVSSTASDHLPIVAKFEIRD